MSPIRFFSQHALDTLKQSVMGNLPWYREEDNTDVPDSLTDYKKMSIQVNPECWDQLNQNPGENNDIQNIISTYTSLALSPQQAADERIWAYATHGLAGNYSAKRWNKIPDDDDKAVKYILAHYFVSGTRGLIRDNAVARLWWMGHVASRCKDYDLKETLTILLRDSDVRANLLERSSVSMSEEMFSAVIRVLGRSLETSSNPAIYKRKNFRALMRMLNRRGGRIMLNALDAKRLDDMLDSMVEEIVNDHNG